MRWWRGRQQSVASPVMRTKMDPVADGAVAANCWVGECVVICFAAVADDDAAGAAIAPRQMHHGVCAVAVMRQHSLYVVAVAGP